LNDIKNVFEHNKKDYIEFNTQIKILKQVIVEKNENVNMLTEEMLTWMTHHHEEKEKRTNFQQQVKVLEERVDVLSKQKHIY
jgi:hypothetical protein